MKHPFLPQTNLHPFIIYVEWKLHLTSRTERPTPIPPLRRKRGDVTTISTNHLLQQQSGERTGRKVSQGVGAGKEGHTKMGEREENGWG